MLSGIIGVRKTAQLLVFLLEFALLAPQCAAQDKGCAELEAVRRKTYGFHPSEVSAEVHKQKSGGLDEFWELVRSKGKSGSRCLAEMLQAEKNDGYFLFDGAVLLEGLDTSGLYVPVVVDSVAHSSLKEVDSASYIDFAMKLAGRGVDIGPIARNYLIAPHVDVFVPVHSLRLDRDLGALLLYGVMPASQRDVYLVAALSSKEAYARHTAAHMLSLSMTDAAFRALAALELPPDFPDVVRRDIELHRRRTTPESSSPSQYSRDEVLARLHRIPGTAEDPVYVAGDSAFARSAIATLTEADLPLLQDARRRSLGGVSDEAIYEYLAHTRILLGVINRLDLFKEFRVH